MIEQFGQFAEHGVFVGTVGHNFEGCSKRCAECQQFKNGAGVDMRPALLTADLYGSARPLRNFCDTGGNTKVKPLFTVYGDLLTFHQKHLLSPLIGGWRSKPRQAISLPSNNIIAGIDGFVKFGFCKARGKRARCMSM